MRLHLVDCVVARSATKLGGLGACPHSREATYLDVQYPPLGVAANINRYGWILNIELPKMGASPQTPKLRGAARHYAVHQVEPHIIFMATKKQERMAIYGV